MKPCDRFEREGLLLLEQGLPLDPHFEECPDCRRARAEYERLGSALAGASGDLEPPPHWQARVWARIAQRRTASAYRKWFLWLAPAAAMVLVLVVLRPGTTVPAGLDVQVEDAGAVVRGIETSPGARLMLRAETGGAEYAELRVYREDRELVLRCSTEPPCVRRGDVLSANIPLPTIGTYQPLLLLFEGEFAAPTGGGLDADSAAALEAGARLEVGREVRVR